MYMCVTYEAIPTAGLTSNVITEIIERHTYICKHLIKISVSHECTN